MTKTAQLAPFRDPNVASRISQMIDQGLTEPGARDVTARSPQGRTTGELEQLFVPASDRRVL